MSRFSPFSSAPLIGVLVAILLFGSVAWAGHLDELLAGVTSFPHHPTPGPVFVFGPNAFPVLIGKTGATKVPVVAAAISGNGRIAAFGDNNYCCVATPDSNTAKFMKNTVKWVSGNKASPRIAITRGWEGFRDFLADNGFDARIAPETGWVDSLAAFDVVACFGDRFAVSDTARLRAWIHGGGGLIIGYAGWIWGAYGPAGKNDLIDDLPANVLLAPEGLTFGADYVDPTGAGSYIVENPPDPLTDSRRAFDTLLRHDAGKIPLADTVRDQAVDAVIKCLYCLPFNDTFIVSRLDTIQPAIVPSPATPVKRSDFILRLFWTLHTIKARRLPVEKIVKSPTADCFPGAVGSAAPRISKTVQVNTDVWDWHSTGLYAAAGETVIADFPENAVGKGFFLQIGSHTDPLWSKDGWVRCPEIVRQYPVRTARVKAASAFGGLVYVIVPKGSGLDTITVSIGNAVPAPYFKLGATSVSEWRSDLRAAPAPWAELACDDFVMTLPADSLRAFDTPDSVMTYWDRIMQGYSSLLGWSWAERRPERMALDADIWLGWLHSGYPFMGYREITRDNIDMTSLKYHNWGPYHELGHNFQSPSWTFGGGGEITNNVQILYLYDSIADSNYQDIRGWKSSVPGNERDQRLTAYFKGKTHEGEYSFQNIDPFDGLLFYIELQEGFGWDAFKQAFRSYIGQPVINSDQEKRDQWMIRFSRIAGRNLSRFFAIWGIPVSDSAKSAVADLTPWIHPELPKYAGLVTGVAIGNEAPVVPVIRYTRQMILVTIPGSYGADASGTVHTLDGRKIGDLSAQRRTGYLAWSRGSTGAAAVVVRITVHGMTVSRKCILL